MSLTGIEFFLVFGLLLAVVLLFTVGSRPRGAGMRPRRRRRRSRVPPIVDQTGPYEVPEDDAPSRSDD